MKEEIKEGLKKAKYAIVYSEGNLRPGCNSLTNIIIFDDIIYKEINGESDLLKDQKEKIDKVWNYVNQMQGVIRTESERVKQLSHVKATSRDEIEFKLDGEVFTLTSKVTEQNAVALYNRIVKEILDIIG